MKIVIIGNSGSGKTWLAKRIAADHLVPLVHLDSLFWEPGGFDKKRAKEQVAILIQESKASDAWLAEGVFGDLAEQYLPDADMLVWLNIDWSIYLQRLQTRGSESKAHMNRFQSKAGLAKLINWASSYSTRKDSMSFEKHAAIFDRFPGNKVTLSTEKEVEEFLTLKRFL